VCLGGGESEPLCITMPGCMGDCPPVENLEAQYLTVNCEALLTWDEPDPIYQKNQATLQGPKPVNNTGIKPESSSASSYSETAPFATGHGNTGSTRAWDLPLKFTYDISGLTTTYTAAIAADNQYIYIGRWSSSSITRLNHDGTPAGADFTIPGISALRGLTYDGTYFYGSNATSQIWKIDMNAHTVLETINLSSGIVARHCSYDPTADGGNGGFWVGNWDDNNLYLVSRTGAQLMMFPPSVTEFDGIYGTAFDNISAGGPYLWNINANGYPVTVGQINLATGQPTGTSIEVASGSSSGGGMFLAPNMLGCDYMLMALVQNEFIKGWEIELPCADCPAAPIPFTATPLGSLLKCKLAWKNPTTTTGGGTLTHIDEIVLMRGGTQIANWTSVSPGQNMSYIDSDILDAGTYCYSVYAVNSSGNGQKANDCALIGDLCEITVEMWDDWGDGWNGGTITVQVDGTPWGTVTLDGDYGTATVVVPSGALELLWTPGSYDCECEFAVYNVEGVEIYHSPANGSFPCSTPGVGMYGISGSFFTTDYECGSEFLPMYKVYRDGALIADYVIEAEYIDYDLDPLVEHEWCVTMMCDEDRESPEVCTSLRACGICYPIENLISVQPSEGAVQFCWTDPADIPGFLGVKIIRDGIIIAPLVALPNLCYTDYVSVGNHLYCFIAMYDKYECSESPAVCHNIYIYPQCDPVTDVTAAVQSTNNVKVTWTLSNALGVIDYSVYRDGLAPGNLLGTTTQMSYIDEGVEPGSHEYCIVVNYDKLPECSASVPACATVFVETCAMVATVTVTSATKESITITWTLSTGVDDIDTVDIYRNSAWIAKVVDETTDTDEDTFTEGATYIYCVVPAYTTCQVTPKCAEAYIEPCVPIDVTNVVATGNQTAKTAYITWNYTGADATFDILRDGKFLTNTAQKNYTDNIEYDVIYKYCIRPVAECAGGAMACDTVVIKTPNDPPPAIDELSGEVSIYPNPANNLVYIKGKEVVQVDIYNVVGQIVESIKSVEGEYISKIDVSAYTSGAYVFKIYTSDKAIVNKPMVIRH
jgi:hypothetical protein